jgi:hypothetical protein
LLVRELLAGSWRTNWPTPVCVWSYSQGAYSHPKYGGNRGKAAWDMIGYYDFWVE